MDAPIGSESQDLVEVYRGEADLDAMTALAEVLVPEGMDALLRDRRTHAFPAPSAQAGGVYLAVALVDAERARAALREAQAAGVLDPARGEVL